MKRIKILFAYFWYFNAIADDALYREFNRFLELLPYGPKSFLQKVCRQWLIVVGLIAALHLIVVGLSGPALFFHKGMGEAYGRETHAAMEWLKAHSAPKDVVLTHWELGHQVVAYAERPVVATSKVYPSEASEVGKRYVDLARFFFATDEHSARKIADAYGVRYVVVPKNFRAAVCSSIWACSFTADKKLSLRGRKETMAGLMTRGASFSFFKTVFNSRNFIIYEMNNGPSRLSLAEKQKLLNLGRNALGHYLNGNRELKLTAQNSIQIDSDSKNVNITLWVNGVLRGFATAGAGSTEDAIIKAAVKAADESNNRPLSKNELAETRIEITLLKDDFAPVDPRVEIASGLKRKNPEFGYRLRTPDGASYELFPWIFNVEPLDSTRGFFSKLCEKAGEKPQCYGDSNMAFESFNIENFIDARSGGGDVLELAAASPLNSTQFSRKELENSLRRAADWTIMRQDANGSYQMITSPFGRKSQEWTINRDAIAGAALVDFWKINKKQKYLVSAVRNAEYLNALVYRGTHPIGISSAGFIALENMSLYEAINDKRYLQNARNILIRGNTQNPLASSTAAIAHFGYSLAKYAALTGDQEALGWAEALGEELIRRFKKDYILSTSNQGIGRYGWTANVGTALFDLTGKKEYGEFALMAADILLKQQEDRGKASIAGAFPNIPGEEYSYVRGAGKAGEGLVDALRIAKSLGRNTLPYKHALEQTFSWIMKMQYDEASAFFIPETIRSDFLGGFRHDHVNPDAWIDAASHFMIAGIGYLNATEQKP